MLRERYSRSLKNFSVVTNCQLELRIATIVLFSLRECQRKIVDKTLFTKLVSNSDFAAMVLLSIEPFMKCESFMLYIDQSVSTKIGLVRQ